MSFNIPNIPSLPDIYDFDDVIDVSDFENYGLYVSCTKKGTKYTDYLLKLQSINNTAFVMANKIRLGIKDVIKDFKDDEYEIEDYNLDLLISRILNPKIVPISKCLANEIINEYDNIDERKFKEILDSNNTEETSFDMETELKKILKEQKINTVTETNKIIKKISRNIVNPKYEKLFGLLDDFQKFIFDTNFVLIYDKWKDIYECLNKNCKSISPYLSDDSFLYFDREKRKFIIPIDINNGRVRVIKFFENLSPTEKYNIQKIEERYFKYLNDKKIIIKDAGRKIKEKYNILDEDNPYFHIYENILPKVSNTVSTLY
jgi:hypothetical protein